MKDCMKTDSNSEKNRVADRKLVYLATPYTHESRLVECERFEKVTYVSALMVERGIVNYSPITHSHQQNESKDLPGNWAFWEFVDREFLRRSDELWVLAETGWSDSVGVTAEIEYAKELGMPVKYINYMKENDWLDFISEEEARKQDGKN